VEVVVKGPAIFQIRRPRAHVLGSPSGTGVAMGFSAAALLSPILLTLVVGPPDGWLPVEIFGALIGGVVVVWWWPVRVLAVTPQGVWLRRYENSPRWTFRAALKSRWSEVDQILIAAHDARPLPAVTVVIDRRTATHEADGNPIGESLSVALCEMPPGWCDPERLMAAIREAAPETSVLRLRRAEALTRVGHSYTVGPPSGVVRLAGATASLPLLAMQLSPDSALLGVLVGLAILAVLVARYAVAPTVGVEPGRIRLGRWSRLEARWPDLDSIRVAVVGRSVQLTLRARPDVRLRHGPFGLRRWPPGQTVNHRLPRSWVDPAELDEVVRAYSAVARLNA
jgi:hypothetical protein